MAMQIKALEKKLKAIAQKEIPIAVSTALNKVAKPLTGSVAKKVATDENLPVGVVRKRVVHHRATVNRTVTYIKSFARGINAARLISNSTLIKRMGTGTNKRGVTVRGRQFTGAFINRVQRNGNVFVMQRRGRERYPVDVIRIPIDEALLRVQLPMAQDRFRTTFEKFYVHELDYRLKKYVR
jgi:hypothetical protein